jgi:Zn-dependent protease with chaperone function
MTRLALLVALLFSSAAAFAQQPAMWPLEAIAKSPAPAVRLHKGPNKTQVGTLSTRRARMIVDVKTKLEKEAGITARLVLFEGGRPNAFSTPVSKDGPLVGINLGMIALIGDDRDAYAAVLGHEYAHLTLKHRESRMDRESLRLAGSLALAILLATQGVSHGAGDIANLATQAVSTTFTRDEERDADNIGLQYSASAGFDPHGAVRVWEKMAASSGGGVPFLASHPASGERVENMRKLAAELRTSAAAAEAHYLDQGVQIHRVVFADAGSKVVVKEMPDDARTTLRVGDALLGCHGAAPRDMTVWNLADCRSPTGAYAFLVERDAEQATAVLLRPHKE